MSRVRFFITLWATKAVLLLMKLLHRNGTFFPGKVALTLCPDFLTQVGKPGKIIAVTGTNGKTTVCNMIEDMLDKLGVKNINNSEGSNIAAGLASSLIAGNTVTGKAKADLAVFEVDERSSLRIYPYVKPDILIITNLFRDSINRNGHPEYIAGIIDQAVPEGTKLLLNADDLISNRIAPGNDRAYFGIDRMDTDGTECVNLLNDMQICPLCSGELEYEYRKYHHIGRAHCRDCDFHSPDSDYLGSEVDLRNMIMVMREAGESYEYPLVADNIVNIYNEVTVIALFRELGYDHHAIQGAIRGVHIVKSRYKVEEAGDIRIILQMGKDKNALACSRTFDYIRSQPGKKEVVLMMNCKEEAKHTSEIMCWMGDCDFEFLNDDSITRIVCSGERGRDFYARLLMADVPEEKLRCELDERKTPPLLELAPGESVYIIYGTDAVDIATDLKDGIAEIVRRRG